VIFPSLGLSKIDLARYVEGVAARMLPHVAGRPLTLCHCPDGLNAPCRFMKHAKQWGPSALRRVAIQEKTKVGEYLVADTIEALVSLIQMGIVEIHTWNTTAEDVERPNRLVWDLDPGPQLAWRDVVDAARLLRELLDVLGLQAWIKTTGGHGLHVVAPLKRARNWDECLTFARSVADAMVSADPQRYTTQFAKHGRERQVLIDYLRNNRTNTSVSAFSARAREGAPVSTPIDWADLGAVPPSWTVLTLPARLRRQKRDPWAGYWTSRQTISRAAFAAVGTLRL
jgi:bifunctional non-homologous end joining protein LigD